MPEENFNWKITGHNYVKEFLERSITTKNLSHAYLFYGPKNIGKYTLALRFSQILECQKDKKPCEQCQSCQYIKKGIHPDITTIKKKEDKKNIAIEQIRELQKKLSLNSFSNGYKTAIIDQAETLSEEGQNSLLKTLEEPTPKTILILVTSKINQIPETIISRSQVIRFKPASQNEIAKHLTQNLKVEKNQAEILASLSFGRPGRAIRFVEDPHNFAEYKTKANDFLQILSSSISERLKLVDTYTNKKDTFLEKTNIFQNILQIWSLIIRDLILIKYNQDNLVNKFLERDLEKIKDSYPCEKLKNMLISIQRTQEYLAQNVQAKLTIENLLFHI
ncbi:DNA polymerase III subunit delta' [Candidatus Falkowbacteria bacterium]|nr:DNA polymerase III subunit delta' [Candidatus Falkowbacteria bacterium]